MHTNLHNHRNPLISELSIPIIPGDLRRRLKRTWCRDLFLDYSPPPHVTKFHQWMVSCLPPVWLDVNNCNYQHVCYITLLFCLFYTYSFITCAYCKPYHTDCKILLIKNNKKNILQYLGLNKNYILLITNILWLILNLLCNT